MVALLLAVPALAAAEDGGTPRIVVMQRTTGKARVAQVMAELESRGRGRPSFSFRSRMQYNGYAMSGFAADMSDEAAAEAATLPGVEYVAPDLEAHAIRLGGDSKRHLGAQSSATWGLDRVDGSVDGSYSFPDNNGAGATVFILDTGINPAHNDFSGGRVTVGGDWVGDGRNGVDCDGHGTHVSSTAAGNVYGVAKSANLVSHRVLGCDGSGSFSSIIAAIDDSVMRCNNIGGPCVISMSLGATYTSGIYGPMETAIDNAVASGVAVTVAAGNDNGDACDSTPAQVASAITVGSTTSSDGRSSFSNYGTCVDIFAPGSSITAAWYTSVASVNTISGTSMACPHVAGAAASAMAEAGVRGNDVSTLLNCVAEKGSVSNAGPGSPNRLLHQPMSGWQVDVGADTDGDGVADCADACPLHPNTSPDPDCGCGKTLQCSGKGRRRTCSCVDPGCVDSDGDGLCNDEDPCPYKPEDACASCDEVEVCRRSGKGRYKRTVCTCEASSAQANGDQSPVSSAMLSAADATPQPAKNATSGGIGAAFSIIIGILAGLALVVAGLAVHRAASKRAASQSAVMAIELPPASRTPAIVPVAPTMAWA